MVGGPTSNIGPRPTGLVAASFLTWWSVFSIPRCYVLFSTHSNITDDLILSEVYLEIRLSLKMPKRSL